jgi:hypothetical protein
MNRNNLGASFRDPSGFLFTHNGKLYRQVNRSYCSDYDHFIASGLYDRLVSKSLIIPHIETNEEPFDSELSYKVIEPVRLNFISYPYEWCFSQYKDAALTTLKIQRMALEFGMCLKDASAYNIQFYRGRPVLIDTLSFELWDENKPWVAYRQFCQHFLAPISLMAYQDMRLGQLMRVYIDGIPLNLASRLLPAKTHFNLALQLHIHLHASSQKRYANKPINPGRKTFDRNAMLGLIENLESGIAHLKWKAPSTEWGNYYDQTNYPTTGLDAKGTIVAEYLDEIRPGLVWDLGANTGQFSQLASQRNIPTLAFDIDPVAVEKCYLRIRKNKDEQLLPLLLDLTNPSPAIGWHNQERSSLSERGPAHTVMALALIHHLAISNNLPLERVARSFSELGQWLIIEFVPKNDSQVQHLLTTRQDIFPNYTPEGFEAAFEVFYEIRRIAKVPETNRCIYLMKKK